MKTLIMLCNCLVINLLVISCQSGHAPEKQVGGSDEAMVPLCERPEARSIAVTLQGIQAKDLDLIDATDRKFSYAIHDMDGDGSLEYFVAMPGAYFCGSGGCIAYILNQDMTVLSRFTVMVFPVYVSTRFKTNGYFDLYAQSQGAYHILKFDGHRYPSNPSSQPVIDLSTYPDKIRLLEAAYEDKCDF